VDRYDAAVVGCGPTGLAAAALLGRRGWHVAAFEKHPTRYSLPRAGHIDHEILRIVQGVGAAAPIIDDNPEYDVYEWFNGAGETLLSFPFGEPSVSGFQSDYMIFQPVLDDALYDAIARSENAEACLGKAVIDLSPDGDGVLVRLAETTSDGTGRTVPTGRESTVRADYVLVADGAGSTIRDELLRIPREDFGFNEAWLAIDVKLKRELPSGINGQWCDPSRPIYIGPLGKRYHRFECAVLPGESEAEVSSPDFAWRILGEHGVGDDDVEIFRQVVYWFESRVAERWRQGNVFLMGDAAHTMPPFMGQGLCSGVRDAANLAWKLDLVRRGKAPASLLDTYEEERRPHVQRWIDLSIAVGRISCTLDPALAASRDDEFLRGVQPSLPEPPVLSGRMVGGLDGLPRRPQGEIFVQAPVSNAGREALLHDLVGHGFLLVCLEGDPRPTLGEEAIALLDRLGCTCWWLGGDGAGALGDPTGRMRSWFADRGVVAALVRPDYYVAASSARVEEISPALARFDRRLGRPPAA